MKVNNIAIICLALIFISGACGKKKLLPLEYRNWVKDYGNEVHKRKQVEQIVFDVQYTPHEFIALNEASGIINEKQLTERKEELKALDYYTLKISLANNKEDFMRLGVQSDKEFYERLYYYSFDFQKDIYLEEENGTLIPCQLFHFERSYDLTDSRTFVLAFKSSGLQGNKTMVINSKDLGLGPIKLLFDKKNLNSIPELKL